MRQSLAWLDNQLLSILDSREFNDLALMNGVQGGVHRSNKTGASIEWKDYTEYMPGDDLRRLDWNLAARFDRYYIRRFSDELRLQHHIYLDGSASMSEAGKRQLAMGLSAALCYLSVRRMDFAAIYLVRGSECRRIGDKIVNETQVYRTAGALEKLSFSGEADLCGAVCGHEDAADSGGISFVISDLLMNCDWKRAMDYLLSCGRKVVLFHILSPQELSPQESGFLRLNNAEAPGDAMNLRVDKAALEAYGKACRAFLKDISGYCKSRSVCLVSVRSDESLADVLLKKSMKAGVIR